MAVKLVQPFSLSLRICIRGLKVGKRYMQEMFIKMLFKIVKTGTMLMSATMVKLIF